MKTKTQNQIQSDPIPAAPRNSVMTLHPFVYHNQWVFDDESKGLDKEAFVSGADTIMDMLYLTAYQATEMNIPSDAQFSLRFSSTPFEGHQYRFDWVGDNGAESQDDGQWNQYEEPTFRIGGWLCPSMLDYFESAPKHIYVEAARYSEGRTATLPPYVQLPA